MRWPLPRTLPAWVLLVVIAGLLATQVATLSIVARERAASNNMLELFRLSDRAFALVKLMYASTPEARTRLATGLSNPGNALAVSDAPDIASPIPSDDDLAELEDVVVGRLARFGIVEVRIRRLSAGPDGTQRRQAVPVGPDIGEIEHAFLALSAGFSQSDKLAASIEFRDGQWLNFVMPMTPVAPLLSTTTLPLFGAVAVLVIAMSIWALRRLTAPYRALESAVKRLGEDLKSPPLPEAGSSEYRSAARAVNAMQARLRDYVAEREQLAAALAHDLRTPLTRIKLRLELLASGKARAALLRDLSDIEAISRSVVDFATYEVRQEKPERIDLWSLVDSIADAYPRQVAFAEGSAAPRGLVCVGRPAALRRSITNLVDNAVTYGGKARLSLCEDGNDILLTVEDEGPGIPEADLDRAFAPFTRLDAPRGRKAGGFGLGLSIARTIARSFGGDIRLENRPGGGLRAELRVPKA